MKTGSDKPESMEILDQLTLNKLAKSFKIYVTVMALSNLFVVVPHAKPWYSLLHLLAALMLAKLANMTHEISVTHINMY